jgi:GWxTD domain-containing protein
MNWDHTVIARAMAGALLHFLWQGAAIAGLLALMLSALRRASAQARYMAACAAMVAMAASFVTTLAMPANAPAAWKVRPLFVAGLPNATAADSASSSHGISGSTWMVALWLAGVAALALRRAGGWLRARRMISSATVPVTAQWMRRLDRLRERIGLTKVVALVESGLAEAPSVIGMLRPVILMPAGLLAGLPTEQVEAILLHELAHVRRHDYLVNLLQSVVEDLLFYHPAVWWVGRVSRRERENCCDDVVVALGSDRREYARTLAALEGMRVGEPALAATGSGLVGRVRRLLRAPEGPRASATPLAIAMVLVCAGAMSLPAWQARAETPSPEPVVQPEVPQPAAPQQRAELPNPYQHWLREDVVYIINDQERAAFERLQTNEEREHFIEQFWQRRDPTPGTVENEFKEEHYRRIAYANQQFTDPAGLAGWKTDRGRVYIVYGPPDEKETHPSGNGNEPPYEEWLYRGIPGRGRTILRFLDSGRDGKYRLATPVPQPPVRQPELPLPPNQPNGDYLYQADQATVRVGAGGATMITVASDGAKVQLRRADGGGVVFDEYTRSPGEPYVKLLTLKPGTYRLEAENMGVSTQVRQLRAQTESMRAQLEHLRETYTENHPRIVALQENVRQLEMLAFEKTRKDLPVTLEFQVP